MPQSNHNLSDANADLSHNTPPAVSLAQIRHSAEHILTMAMELIYGPDKIIMAMGPATDEGYYYDFETRGLTISEEDFPQIENKMRDLIKQNLQFVRAEIAPDLARQVFATNPYKLIWIDEAAARGETVTIYYTGQADLIPAAQDLINSGKRPQLQQLPVFVDVCRGPHVTTSQQITAVKLLSLAGAYWRGDANNIMLTRIYGTAFATAAELDQYLEMLEQARQRDHRRLGKELDLFTFSDLVGPGLPLWSPKGNMLRTILDDYVWKLRSRYGFQKVTVPHITKKDLYETSGHWAKFAEELFRIKSREGHEFALKPMNCPHHTQIFARRPHSYREMPQRYCETTMCYRDEQTGELHGLSRVRSFTQDDSHVFCRYSQIPAEINIPWNIIEEFYRALGMDLRIRLSLHDPNQMDKYLGTPEVWHELEGKIRQVVAARGVTGYSEALGEAAFYGPKVDFMARDAIGREWQIATIQLDFNMPKRFGLSCVNEQGELEEIAMIHVAVMGSIERFLSIMIEHFAGAFPVWLSPVQAVIVPVTEKQEAYAGQLGQHLQEAGVRVEVSAEAETMQNRIRKAEGQKVPFVLVVGQKEADAHESGQMAWASAVRGRGRQNLGVMAAADLIQQHLTDPRQM